MWNAAQIQAVELASELASIQDQLLHLGKTSQSKIEAVHSKSAIGCFLDCQSNDRAFLTLKRKSRTNLQTRTLFLGGCTTLLHGVADVGGWKLNLCQVCHGLHPDSGMHKGQGNEFNSKEIKKKCKQYHELLFSEYLPTALLEWECTSFSAWIACWSLQAKRDAGSICFHSYLFRLSELGNVLHCFAIKFGATWPTHETGLAGWSDTYSAKWLENCGRFGLPMSRIQWRGLPGTNPHRES